MGDTHKSKTTVNGLNPNNKNRQLAEQILEISQILWDVFVLFFHIFYTCGESIYKYIVPPPPKSVKGEIVLITGTGHGMGRELAILYASKGATVVGWDINKSNNEDTINEIKQRGYPKAHAYNCDVSNRENVFEVAKKVQEEVGDVTILINNAGIMPTHPILEQTKEEIERVFGINVFAHFWTIQAFLPVMKKNRHGHIVALSSSAGLCGLENLVPYCASKFAVRGLMESLNEEMREEKINIRVTTICPYMVDTGLCKKPKVRFENAMPLLKPAYAAKMIMRAQRTNKSLVGIPGYLVPLTNYTRLLPMKASYYVKDFFNTGVESDL